MAEIILCPLLEVVLNKVASRLLKEVALTYGFEDEIDKLRHSLSIIQAVVEDAEERQVNEKALRIWLADLKEVAYDIDGLFDVFDLDVVMSRSHYGFGMKKFLPSLKPVAAYLELLPKLKEIRKRLEFLAAEKVRFSLKQQVVETRCDAEEKRQTGSFVIESEVVGRDQDKEAILELVLSNGGSGFNGRFSVIPIVGLGGLGETTLAQLAYNDERVTEYFELRIWVCVNEEFNVRRIMKMIIESVTVSRSDFLGMDVLQSQLRSLLRGRRYLLVLDDVWNEDPDEWDKLRISLSDGGEGSKVIVTTCSTKVALLVGTASPFYIKTLSDDDCWLLFKQRAFAPGEDYPKLEAIGREIVRKCGGIPMAAKALGSLMRFKREEEEWLYVQESDIQNACEGEDGVLRALRLSYSHLPSHLKCCFAYCSVFPKNYVIKKENLIHLWIAEGLIQSKERKSLEDIGNEYFTDLMWMFFFQDVNKDCDGSVTECKMHNLIHDLAQSVAGDESVVLVHGNVSKHLARTHHSSVVCDSELQTIPESLYEAKKLRTLNLLFSKGNLGEAPPKVFSSFRCLRALNLCGSGIKKLSDSIASLVSLRYLNISNTLIETLPETVCELSHLQVLDLSYCCDLTELPRLLTKIFKLRHLIINGCDRLSHLPDNIGRLLQLQTLPIFIVGTQASQSLKQLYRLPIGGELKIQRLENAVFVPGAIDANLRDKPKLRSVGLSWGSNHDGSMMRNDENDRVAEELLMSLRPHQNLKSLSIEGYPGGYFPRWIRGSNLPNLTNIKLINCRRCEQLPALGQIPFVKVIYMRGMPAVKNIGSGFCGRGSGRPFQSLQELTFIEFPNLEFWQGTNAKEEFPSLFKLTVNGCPRLKNLPFFSSLQHLELRNCNEMILRSATNLSTLLNLVIDVFTGELVILETLLQNNPCLTYLTICSCPNFRSISSKLGSLIALKSLTIRWCQQLISLPQEIQNLSSLESLEISECSNLKTLPEGIRGLSSLRSLSIENCSNLTSVPNELQHLTALEHLVIMYCPSLDSLPANFRNFSMLKSLFILGCPKLASLPEELQHVTSLRSLEIHSCPAFENLPGWIGNLSGLSSLALSDCPGVVSLPEGLHHLTSLQHLSIRDCPRLENRCKKNVGEDWLKIAHIPYIYIGSTTPKNYNNASSSSC
ncbi:disease resistance protein RGA2-like isoform X1 [Mangifera indica]|uniref:disease resistance protein RGA2-like isoform X1 n=1 Tax=Mangifera indica TaxID=29780 RepID=UPI001CFC2D22|nr:disease resistance protein RGA2-like isoform X1 [Mangifera indica]